MVDTQNSTINRELHLDFLRGAAILMVLLQHWLPSDFVARKWIPFGALGVQMFVVQSGYLITANLLRIKDGVVHGRRQLLISVVDFWKRRFWRLGKIYYPFLILTFVLVGQGSGIANLAAYAFFGGNVFSALNGKAQPGYGHYWVLAVIAQFYLLWPAVIFGAKNRILPLVIWCCVFVGLVYKPITLLLWGNWEATMHQFPSMLEGFSLGSLMAVHRGHSVKSALWDGGRRYIYIVYALFFVVLVSVLYSMVDFHYLGAIVTVVYVTLGYLILSIVSMLLMVGTRKLGGGDRGISGLVVKLGMASYVLYVSHPLIQRGLDEVFAMTSLSFGSCARVTIYAVVSILLSYWLWLMLDKPTRHVKRSVVEKNER